MDEHFETFETLYTDEDMEAGHHPHPEAKHHRTRSRARNRVPRRLRVAGIGVAVAASAAVIAGIVVRRQHESELANWTAAQAEPIVAIALPAGGPAGRELTLPADVEAYYEAPIYARVSGYLHRWYEDIGATVKAGQVLATIDAPDLDQELAQAQADLNTARARYALADLTARRWHALLSSNSVSQQSVDEKAGDAEAERAVVNAAQAKVDRLNALEGFKRLVAPFDGIVTARNTDIGALINAGSSAAVPLFKVADMHEMRVYVRVPQSYSSELHPGVHATLTEPQYPGVSFPAELVTTSQSVAADSRTVLVELKAPNPDHRLWAGTYAEVKFDLPGDANALRVPASALIFRAQGSQIAVVGPDDRVAMKRVTVSRDLGTELEISAGLDRSDRIVTSPPDTLENGDLVQVAPASPATPSGK